MSRGSGTLVVLLAVAVSAGACSRKPQPVSPAPQPEMGQDDERLRQQREAEERGRREAEEARRRSEEAARLRATLEQTVYFDYDSFQIRSDARDDLNAKVPLLRADPSVRMLIEGHADERGSVEYNFALGMRRAMAVKQYLSNFDLDPARFETVSFGEERPVAQGSSESAWSRNRRAEFRVIGERMTNRP